MMVMGSLLSCSDNETTPEENVNPDTTNKGLSLISEFNAGEIHNGILDVYYNDNDYSSDDISIKVINIKNFL